MEKNLNKFKATVKAGGERQPLNTEIWANLKEKS
jgi:hypothetical protein